MLCINWIPVLVSLIYEQKCVGICLKVPFHIRSLTSFQNTNPYLSFPLSSLLSPQLKQQQQQQYNKMICNWNNWPENDFRLSHYILQELWHGGENISKTIVTKPLKTQLFCVFLFYLLDFSLLDHKSNNFNNEALEEQKVLCLLLWLLVLDW